MSSSAYTILLIAQDIQTHNWVDHFSKDKFNIYKTKTAIGGLQKAINQPVSLILFDSDRQECSANEFVQQMEDINLSIPVITLTSNKNKSLSSATHGILQKPFSQMDFDNSIDDFFQKQEKNIALELKKGRQLPKIRPSEIMVGFRKPANIYKVSKQGMVLTLPTAIREQAKLLFKGAPLYQQLQINNISVNRVEMVVTECSPTIKNRFKVVAQFIDTCFKGNEKSILDSYIDQYSSKVVSASQNHGTVLIFSDGQGSYDSYRFYLEGSPYKFQFVNTPEAALTQTQTASTIDCLIIDSDKLSSSITAFMESLNQQKRRLPIILVTGDKDQRLITRVAPFAQDLIIKPVNGKVLLQRLSKVKQRWGQEEQIQKKIGESVGVSIETKILVVFRDQAEIQRVRKDGILLYKEYPIIPTTSIYFRANRLFELLGVKSDNITHIELEVISCQYDLEKNLYRIIAVFKDIKEHLLKAIHDFLRGKLNPGSVLVEPEPVPKVKEKVADKTEQQEEPQDDDGWLFLKDPESDDSDINVGHQQPVKEDEEGDTWLFLKDPDEDKDVMTTQTVIEGRTKASDEPTDWGTTIHVEEKKEEFVIPPRPKISQYSLNDLFKAIPNCKASKIENTYFGDEFFAKDEKTYSMRLKTHRSQSIRHNKELKVIAEKHLSNGEQFYKQRFNTKIMLQERAVLFHISDGQLECFLMLGATLKTVPKGMGISDSLVEDKYEYDPYYLIGIPKPIHLDFGMAAETRIFMDRNVDICVQNNKDLVQLLPSILKLL